MRFFAYISCPVRLGQNRSILRLFSGLQASWDNKFQHSWNQLGQVCSHWQFHRPRWCLGALSSNVHADRNPTGMPGGAWPVFVFPEEFQREFEWDQTDPKIIKVVVFRSFFVEKTMVWGNRNFWHSHIGQHTHTQKGMGIHGRVRVAAALWEEMMKSMLLQMMIILSWFCAGDLLRFVA